jgi:hypothetical protein
LKPSAREGRARFAPVEFSSTAAYFVNPASSDALHCIGGLGLMQYNFNSNWGGIAEVGGCKMFGFSGSKVANFSGDILTYSLGARHTWHSGRWMPYVQLLGGGKRITINEELVDLKAAWRAQNPGKIPGYELHSLWTKFNQANGFALQGGVGLEMGLTESATLQVFAVDYNYAWLPRSELAAYPNSLRLSTGIKIRMGSW